MGLRLQILALLALLSWAPLAFAGVEQISEAEFRSLASELAPKVNLFHATWEKDPNAEFYGGTTRDYLYWLKGQFQMAKNHEEAQGIANKLRNLPAIDVRDFIIGDSDVDIIGGANSGIRAESFGVRKIDFQSPEILDPKSVLGQNEILQGYIPAEKIRLSRVGLTPALGDGVAEIYQGKLTVQFASAEDFAKSKYAKEGINHPILLALRYLRLQAINYFRSHGDAYPNLDLLLHEGMNPESAAAVRKVIEEASMPGVLQPYLAKSKFKSWINGGIQKAFRSYTNPTAALELMKAFKVNLLPELYPHEIETLNQYVFNKYRDPAMVAENLKKFSVDEKSFFSAPETYFTDGKLYHGTKTEPAFRGILFQGVLPSEGGSAGPGLYGVAERDKQFSERWGGDKNRLLSFDVDPKTKLVDVTKGEGLKIWNQSRSLHGGDFEKFSDLFGADIIRYPYNTQAFVVENAAVLSGAQGVYRSMMTLAQLIEAAKKESDPHKILNWFSVNQISLAEEDLIWRASAVTPEKIADFLRSGPSKTNLNLLRSHFWLSQAEVRAVLVHDWLKNYGAVDLGEAFRILNDNAGLFDDAQIPDLLEKLIDPSFSDYKIWLGQNQILRYFAKRKIFSTKAKKLAFDRLAALLARPGEDFHGALIYLASIPLSEADLEKLFKLTQISRPSAATVQREIAELLVGDTNYRQKIYDQYSKKASLSASATNYSMKDHWNDILFLRKYFPEDQGVIDIAYRYFSETFDSLGANGAGNIDFRDVLPMIGGDPRIKQLLLNQLNNKNDYSVASAAVEGLSQLSLSDEDVVKILDSDFNHTDAWARVIQLLKNRSSPITPEIQYALIRDALKHPNSKIDLVAALRLPANDSKVSDYVGELIDEWLKGKSFPGITGSMNGLEHGVASMMWLLTYTPLQITPGLEDKMLSLIEKTYNFKDAENDINVRHIFGKLKFHDPSSAKRLETLLLKRNIMAGWPVPLAKIVPYIPQPSPEFRKLVADLVAQQYRGRAGNISAVETEIRTLEQYLKNTENHAPVSGTCAGNFANLAPR